MKAIAIVLAGTLATASITSAQERQTPDPAVVEKRNALEKELEEVAMIERKVTVPMRDDKRMATDIYRPELDFTHLCGIAEGLL